MPMSSASQRLRAPGSPGSANPSPALAPSSAAVWWRLLFELSDDAQLVCDPEGLILDTNRRASDQLGLARQTNLLKGGVFAAASSGRLQEHLHTVTSDAAGPAILPSVALSCPRGACLVADLHVLALDEHH